MSVAPISSTHAKAPAQFNAAALRRAEPEVQRAAVAQQFEAVLVRQMLGKTLNSMLGGEKGGVSGSVYGDMLSDTISQQLTAGPGLGLGRFIQQQLTPKHGSGAGAREQGSQEPVAVSPPSSSVSTK
jgi:Rod binding domain-containing protein